MTLRRPTLADKDTILDMLAEFEAAGSTTAGGFISKDVDFVEWLEKVKLAELGLEFPEGFVPYVQYVSFDQTGRALGFLNLRLRLNDSLLKRGGHIGYSIRPTERGKGYAKEQLRLGVQEAFSKNIPKVLVTCDETNTASKRTILACGGSLEDVRHGTERYYIEEC
ncbi:GNAT family N-acetyltransferase [Streptococcus suis]|nr:GNAT family N-acetyltransferase [Streptococcus suis]